MAKREFLQLAHVLKPTKNSIGGWWYSEKLDGERCFWDGGVSRGIDKFSVPWANNTKDERYIEAPVATGLWSRYGNVIHAPDWWLNELPKIPLDAEFYASRDIKRQTLHSWIKTIIPDDELWSRVTLRCFDMPPLEIVLADGLIDNINYSKILKDCVEWVQAGYTFDYWPKVTNRFETSYFLLGKYLEGNTVAVRHTQYILPFPQHLAIEKIQIKCGEIVAKGGEGLIVRDPNSTYQCERSHKVLKVKPADDMEGTVIGYITGRETDKGSKLLGMMGALILQLDSGVRLELSGFTNQERDLEYILTKEECNRAIKKWSDAGCGHCQPSTKEALDAGVVRWARFSPETECLAEIQAKMFPRGTRVTFKYRGLTRDGVPQEARYFRKDERI